MIYLLTIDNEYESARRLGFQTVSYLPGDVFDYDHHLVLRWGNSCLSYNNDKETEFKNVLNSFSSISLNVKKREALVRMSSVVNTPKIFNGKVPNGKMGVIRPCGHTGGEYFEVKMGPYDIPGGCYSTEFIKTNTELRAWYCGDRVLVAKRIPLKNQNVEQFPCRSGYGYKFCKIPVKLKRQVLLAARSIGLQYGAADILRVKRKFYFCENNSAPTIDHRKIRLFFQSAFPVLIKRKYPQFVAQIPEVVIKKEKLQQ